MTSKRIKRNKYINTYVPRLLTTLSKAWDQNGGTPGEVHVQAVNKSHCVPNMSGISHGNEWQSTHTESRTDLRRGKTTLKGMFLLDLSQTTLNGAFRRHREGITEGL